MHPRAITGAVTAMRTQTKIILTVLAFGTLAFLANGNAPLGRLLWPPHADAPAPTGIQVPLLVLATAIEALLFGVGIALLAWGWRLFARAPAPRALSRAAHLCLVWLLVSWFPHDNLHPHYGESMGAIVALVWGFHVTLGLAGAVLAGFALATARGESARTTQPVVLPAEAAAVGR